MTTPNQKIHAKEDKHDANKVSVTPALLKKLREDIINDNSQEVIKTFQQLHYPDQAILLETIKTEMQEKFIKMIANKIQKELLEELLHHTKQIMIKILGNKHIGKIVEQMSTESIVGFVETFNRQERIALLKCVNINKRKLVRIMAKKTKNSASMISNSKCIVVEESMKIIDAIEIIKQKTQNSYERIYDIFAQNKKGEITGIVSVIQIIRADANSTISSIMKENFISVKSTDSTREIVYIFNKYDLNTVPVLNEAGELDGAISIDTVRYIADEQGEEDLLKMSGVLSDLDESIVDTTKVRFVWLLVNLVTTVFASWIISFFEHAIHKITALAVLMPITVSMGSNAGTQTLTVITRALTTKSLNTSTFKQYFNKELTVSILNSLLFALICVIGVFAFYKNIALASVFGIAIGITILSSVVSGILIPILMRSLGTDPAVTAIVFLTAVIDVVAFLSFLGLANIFLIK